jgi:hypothetical protein
MRKTLTTAALLLAFSCPTFAGEMATPGSPTPPPTTANATQEPTDAVHEPTTGGEIPNDLTGSLTGIVLEMLAVLPSLL